MGHVEGRCDMWEVDGTCGRYIGHVGGIWEVGGTCGR